MPAYHVQRSITINAPAEKVFDTVADYSNWTQWSPWMCIDKAAQVTVSDDPRSVGSLRSWAGEVVGEGEIEHRQLDRPSRIEDEIRFVRPFKSRSNVAFDLASDGGGTKITWHMNGKLPWFLFWMKSMMQTYIGMDYQRGLKMLKEYVETAAVLSNIEVLGVQDVAALDVIGVRDSCTLDNIGPAMEKANDTANSKMKQNNISTDGDMIGIYHSFDMKQQQFDFTTGYVVDNATNPPAPLKHTHLPAGKSLVLRHTGSYENLGNAWSGAYQYARYKKLKIAKQAGYEIYRNSPDDTPPAELITDVYMPLK